MIRVLSCVACAIDFSFTDAEQQYFQSRGFEEPSRCPDCRKRRKLERSGVRPVQFHQGGGEQNSLRPKKMYHTKCFSCGSETTVNFRPSYDHPALCSGCDQGMAKRRRRMNYLPR